MTFREFLDALCYVSGEQISVFVARTFLSEVTQDNFKSILNNISDDVIKSYLRPERNISKKFADEIESCYQREYLEEHLDDICCEDEKLPQLCDAFRRYCPDINEDNAIELVVKQFEKILKSAGKRKPSKKSSKKKCHISKEDVCSIQAVIVDLQYTVEKLQECSTGLLITSKESHLTNMEKSHDEWQSKFNQNYETFQKKNIELHYYAIIYPEIEVIDTIFNLSNFIDFASKYINKDNCIYIDFDSRIDEYKAYLKQLTKIIHTK
ncbi:MAG: hypothetical protein IKI37_11610 [Oscillospiraceae bacterium]|nr:hypothetical protein [Oscillospiraceae bacterium]